MPSLFVIQGRDQGKRFELDRPLLSLGRDGSCTIQLSDTEVSRKHIEISIQEDIVQLVDLKSSNGTFVNGQRLQSTQLNSGDRIQVGRTLMIFTGSQTPQEFANQVEVVTQPHIDSQIISTVPQSSATLEETSDDAEWLARARSNLQVMYRTALAVSHTMDIDQLLVKIMELIF